LHTRADFAYLVVDNGELQVVRGAPPTYTDLTSIVGGGIEGVPIPGPTDDPVLGYCNNNGFALGLGANCYVVGLRYPIPGPLVVVGQDDEGGDRSLTEAEVAAFSMKALPGRPLPTLSVQGFDESHDGADPATHDPYRPGEAMEPPEATFIAW
jgi:hypothetical protein